MTHDTDNDHHSTAGGNARLRVLVTLLLAGRPNLWYSTHNLPRKHTHTHSHDLQTLGRYTAWPLLYTCVILRMLVTYNQVPVPVVVPCVLSSITLPPNLEVHSSIMELKNQSKSW